MEEKKRIYLAVLTIITVAAIIFGSAYHILGAFYKIGQHFSVGKKGSSEMVDISNDYEDDISAIDIECATSKIIIEAGDKYNVSFKGIEKLSPAVSVSDGRLVVKQKGDRDLDLGDLRDKGQENILTITIDEDRRLENLNLDVAMGDVKMDDVEVDNITIDAAMGNVNADDVECSQVTLSAAMGNITLTDSKFADLKASADMGNIAIDTDEDIKKYDIEASSDMGNVKINGEKVSGKGTYKSEADGAAIGKIVLDCDMGNIDLN